MGEDYTFYDLLGVKSDSSPEQIREAFKRNAAKYHPDVNSAPNAQVMMTMLNEAWETLKDAARKRSYDESLAKRPKSAKASGASSGSDSREDSRRRAEADRARQEAEAARQTANAKQRVEWERAERQRQDAARRAEIARAASDERTRLRIFAIAAVVALFAAWQFFANRHVVESSRMQTVAARKSVAPVAIPTSSAGDSVDPHPVTTGITSFQCMRPGVAVGRPAPLVLSEIQYKRLFDSYKDPVVLGLRHSLDEYLNGTAGKYTTQILSETPRALLAKSFMLLDVNNGPAGGTFLTIQFGSDVSRVYRAWVYRLASGSFELRGWYIANCTASQQHWITITYGPLTKRILHDLTVPASVKAADNISARKASSAARSLPPSALVSSESEQARPKAGLDGINCARTKIVNVESEGATVTTSDGRSYTISTAGIMRYSVSSWSTGDAVVVCTSGQSSSIANAAHSDKVQAEYRGASQSSALACSNAVIRSVADEGATVTMSNGRSYTISTAGIMRYSVSSWSTGDAVVVCTSGQSSSIANAAHSDKVQASKF